MNRYFLCRKDFPEPIPWGERPPFRSERFGDFPFGYLDGVFRTVDKLAPCSSLTIYVTRDLRELPSYGDDIVAVVVGDEWGRVPLYSARVRTVFKTMGFATVLGCNPILQPSLVNCLATVQYARNLIAAAPGHALAFRSSLRAHMAGSRRSSRHPIPLGYYNQLDLPLKPFVERAFDVGFAGSLIQAVHSPWSPKRYLGTPKSLSRNSMLEELRRFSAKHPDVHCDIHVTRGYLDNNADGALEYSQRLMNTRICIAPRGTSFETFRLFEALRYGCIVITEALPRYWFYEGAPVIRVRDWRQLDGILIRLLNDPVALNQLHESSLRWWHSVCSAEAVGQFVARNL